MGTKGMGRADFDEKTWKRAQDIARGYRLVFEAEDDGYLGSALEMPTVLVHATTIGQGEKKLRQALTAAIATMIESGREPPLPATRRSVQVNIRLTAEEKLRIEERAQQAGFRGVSDYMRHAALAGQ